MNKMMMKKKLGMIAATLVAGSLALSACGTSNTSNTTPESGGSSAASGGADMASQYKDCKIGADAASATSADTGDKTIKIGAFSGWDESIASANLMKAVLEKNGYTASVKVLSAAPGFIGVAKGDIDLLTDVWLPTTHKDYLNKYGDKMEPLGCWYGTAKLTIAVNSSSPAKTIADLKTDAKQYDNTLVGIEPGAGETGVVKNDVIPQYGLDGMKFTTSSTSAMLSAIARAEKKKTNVAVTLWKPHWAYAAYDVRDLEDPKGALGGQEGIWNFATKGFSDKHPKAAQLFKNLVVPDAKLAELEKLMTQKYKGEDPSQAVNEWLKDNPDFEQQIEQGKLPTS